MIEQAVIAITGLASLWLTQQRKEGLKKYACLFGLAAQPFWLYSAYKADQYGIMMMCFAYTAVWLMGFKNYWLNKGETV